MKAGYKTTEFWIVVVVIAYALTLATGILKPSHISGAAQNIKEGTDALPGLMDAFKNLLDKYGELAVMAGLAWTYIKKRSKEKIEVLRQGTIQEIPTAPDTDVMVSVVKTAIKEMLLKKATPPPTER
jgi:hypothetical protein